MQSVRYMRRTTLMSQLSPSDARPHPRIGTYPKPPHSSEARLSARARLRLGRMLWWGSTPSSHVACHHMGAEVSAERGLDYLILQEIGWNHAQPPVFHDLRS